MRRGDDLVGVVVPMHNAAGTIARTLRSLRAQDHRSWIAVIVDDGSTDAGPDLVRWLSAGDERIMLVQQARAGVAAARNRGMDELDALRVPFVAWLDADDTLTPGAMGAMLSTIKRSGCPAALGDFEFVNSAGQVLGRHAGRGARVSGNDLLGSVFMLVSSQLVRRDALRGARFRTDLSVIEDTDLWLRLGLAGVTWARTPEVVTQYTMHAAARSLDLANMARLTAEVYRQAFARARAVPAGAGGGTGDVGAATSLDASEPRLRGVLARAALNYATRAALLGEHAAPSLRAAVDLWQTHAPANLGEAFDAAFLQRTAARAAMMVLAIDPEDPCTHARWHDRARAWWGTLQHHAVISEATRRSAEASLLRAASSARSLDHEAQPAPAEKTCKAAA